jgi:hypothetical protein
MVEVTFIGGNLYQIAAANLGNALQWINIARANNLKDPILYGQNQLTIPEFSSDFADGIGPQ